MKNKRIIEMLKMMGYEILHVGKPTANGPDAHVRKGALILRVEFKKANSNGIGGKPRFGESHIRGRKSNADKRVWWSVEPNVGRVANGVPSRVDRIKCLGNAVVPMQAREAFMRLAGLK